MKERKYYIDAVKIVAILFVIYSHSGIYTLYYVSDGILPTLIYLTLALFAKAGVPLFLMCSGALLIPRNEEYHSVYKRIFRFIAIITVYGSVSWVVRMRSFSLPTVIFNIFADSVDWTSWYLYAYLGFLVSLPFLRKIAGGGVECNDIKHLIIWHFIIYSLIPILNFFLINFGEISIFLLRRNATTNQLELSESFQIPLMTVKAVFYPLLGYYFSECKEKYNRQRVMLFSAIGILINVLVMYFNGQVSEMNQIYIETFDYATTIFVFLYVKGIMDRRTLTGNNKMIRVVSGISRLTLGLYFADTIFKSLWYRQLQAYLGWQDPLYSIFWIMVVFIIGGICTFILRKIPIVKFLF